MTKFLWSISIVAGTIYTALFFILSIPRLLYPYELEWMEGAIADHAVRIVEGKQLYVRPTIEFVNWLYQPLYYYASAAAMQIFGVGFFAGRFISFCSTLLSTALIFFIVRKITTERFLLPFLAASLFLASYGITGYTHDIGRIDALLVFLLLASAACLVFRQSYLSVICSSIFISLAFFTKQPAVFYILPCTVWLFLKDKKLFSVFVLSTAILIGTGFLILTAQNGQWYEYYVFAVPRGKAAHGGFGCLSTLKAFPDFIFSFWSISSFMILAFFFLEKKNGLKTFFLSQNGLLILIFLTSVIQLAFQFGDHASYKNIALPFVSFSSMLFPIALKKNREKFSGIASQVFLLTLPIQFVALIYNPLHDPLVVINGTDRLAGEKFYSMLHELPGNVYIPAHGFLPQLAGKHEFANDLAMGDVFTVDDTTAIAVKKEYYQSLALHYFSFIITDDNLYRTMYHMDDSITGYTFCKRINNSSVPFISRIGDYSATPCKLFIPKTSE